jgi:pimeloyl-ACP methyl ester carboxylesterase
MPRIFSATRNRRYVANLLCFTLLLIVIAVCVVIPLSDAYRGMHPVRYPIGSATPAGVDLPYVDVTLRTGDGLALSGWYVPSQNGAAVILVHAFNGNRTGVIYHAALLAQHGYGALLYDMRAHGESDGGLYAWGWDTKRDVRAAVEYLLARPDVDSRRIGAAGFSAGARAVLYAAAEDGRIAAVVAEGCGRPTFSDWWAASEPAERIWTPVVWMTYTIAEVATGIRNPTPLLASVPGIAPRPVLFIAAGEDRTYGRALYDAAKDPKDLWIRDEPGHIDALFARHDEYEDRVIGFLDRALTPIR